MDVHSGWAKSGFRSKLAGLATYTQFEPRTERTRRLTFSHVSVCVFER